MYPLFLAEFLLLNVQIVQCVLIRGRTEEEIRNGIYLNGGRKKAKRAVIKQNTRYDGSLFWDKKYKLGLWNPEEPIEYSFDGSLTQGEKQYVHLAVEYWQNHTCLDFQHVNDDHFEYRIVFRKLNYGHCSSPCGRSKTYGLTQFVNLGPGCIELDLIVHEIGHALGLAHEHQRPDRDEHLNILWWNVQPAYLSNFELLDIYDYFTFGLPFDHGSIMSYGAHISGLWQFYGLPLKQTIEAKRLAYQLTLGSGTDISFLDLKGLHIVYCEGRCRGGNLTCKRGGFLNPRNCGQCVCPHGFAGRDCSELSPHSGVRCGGEHDLSSTMKGYQIRTPKWPKKFYPLRQEPKGQSCTWLLRAPVGHVVEMRIQGSSKVGRFFGYIMGSIFLFNIARRYSSCLDYVEVKNSTDFSNTGMRKKSAMSTDRYYVRCRSRSPVSYRIRRSLSFDPYIFRRSDSFASYDQHVRRSFTPAREKMSETVCRYYFTPPYEYHVPRLARSDTASDYFYSTYREGSSNPFRVTTHVLDDRPFRSNPRYNIYIPSGWSTPLYKYMNPHSFRTYSYSGNSYFDNNYSLTTTLKPTLTRAYAPSYLSSYGNAYRPSCTTGEIYYYHADSKKRDDQSWKRWYDRGSIIPGYRNYYGESGLRHFAGFAPRLSQHYCTAIWV